MASVRSKDSQPAPPDGDGVEVEGAPPPTEGSELGISAVGSETVVGVAGAMSDGARVGWPSMLEEGDALPLPDSVVGVAPSPSVVGEETPPWDGTPPTTGAVFGIWPTLGVPPVTLGAVGSMADGAPPSAVVVGDAVPDGGSILGDAAPPVGSVPSPGVVGVAIPPIDGSLVMASAVGVPIWDGAPPVTVGFPVETAPTDGVSADGAVGSVGVNMLGVIGLLLGT